MNQSPVEAINRINKFVTVEMFVQRTKSCTGSRQVFLDSNPSPIELVEGGFRRGRNAGA